ncbi:MAG: hypothetical protein IPK16_12950 [Anaerolineales bacterium]|nr:hypothetical protein [Anaerolineales bacterium]
MSRRFAEGVLALLVTGVLFLPLARNAWLSNANDSTPGRAFDAFLPNLWHQLQIATFWRVDWPDWVLTSGLVFGAMLVILGLTLPWPRRRRGHMGPFTPDLLFLWVWLATPLLVGNVLLARNETIFGEDRYFLFLVPFVLWAAARGIVAVAAWAGHVKRGPNRCPQAQPAGKRRPQRGQSRWPTIVVAAVLGGVAVLWLAAALPRLWTPAMAREDWRATANYIAGYQAASPGLPGAAVAHIDYTRMPLERYLRQSAIRTDLAVFFPFGGALAPDDADEVVAPPLIGLERDGVATLWLTQSHLEGMDDARVVEGWLNARYPIVTEQYPAGIKLSGYAVASHFDQLPPLNAAAVYPDAELAPGLRLAACEILTPELAATDERMHPPSGWVHVRLWWEATGEITDDYIATVQAIGPEGVWGDRLYRENEALRKWPTRDWAAGAIVRDEIDVNLNPVMPPGSYPIVVGLRDSANNETGAKVECGRITIVR